MNKFLFTILALYFTWGVFSSTDIIQSDRDNAAIISARALINLQSPYDFKTEIGQPITTGLFNAVISIPFVYLFGNIQVLSFLFYMLYLVMIYRSEFRNYFLAGTILLTPFLYRVMFYRLDELYWVVIYFLGIFILKTKYKYLLIIPVLFSRNILNFNFRAMLPGLDYWLLIILLNNIILIYALKYFRRAE